MLSLQFEPALENLGDAYWDVVKAAEFPLRKLRFRNDALLKQLGINPEEIADHHLEEAYGEFNERYPLLALRYHGYQFGTYNPFLGDGRGFLYGQLRDRDGQLQDLGTKGSGQTPWSRGGDGRLTLKGGVREIIASETLHRLGVNTSRTLSLIETGEMLWRGDEPSPTRSSVMVRMARTHLRFGTCERLLYLKDPQRLERLLRHVIEIYYPDIAKSHPIDSDNPLAIETQLLAFYKELVNRIAKLAAEWMVAGFTHGVLNTDNMSLAGESFDYGPFAFLEYWDPEFIAAYFDETGLYAFGRQPTICHHNLHLLQDPLAMLLPREPMEEALDQFAGIYQNHYQYCLKRRLGFEDNANNARESRSIDIGNNNLLKSTLELLANWKIEYGEFFSRVTKQIRNQGLPQDPEELTPHNLSKVIPPRKEWLEWRDNWWLYQNKTIAKYSDEAITIPKRLHRWNMEQIPTRAMIEDIWKSIEQDEDWGPMKQFLESTSIN